MKLNLSFKRGRAGGGNKLDIKQFLFQHAEKILLGLACLFMLALLVHGSRSGSDFDAQRAPKDLASLVRKAEDQINRTAWDVYRPERDRTDRRPLTDRADDALKPVSVESYPTPIPLEPLIFPPRTKRSDPELLPVRDLVARAGYGALAVKPETTEPVVQPAAVADEATRPLPRADELELPEASELVSGGNAKGVHFVCLTGRIPFRDQLNEYNRCFRDAAEYSPTRDYPRYFTYRIQRAEIPPAGGEPQWFTLPFPSIDPKSNAFRESWSGNPPELADEQYIVSSPEFRETAFQLPPLMGQDLKKWAVHDGIPLAKTDEFSQREQPVATTTVQPKADDPFGKSEGVGEPEEPMADRERAGGADWRRGRTGTPRSEVEASTSASGERDAETEYKLFRYFDFDVQPGKSYQYRVQLWLEDPNYPKEESQAPGLGMLSTEAADRIRPKTQEPNKAINHYRDTAWSEPTPAVTVPQGSEVLVGVVTPRDHIAIRSRNARFPKPYDEPRAQGVVLDWDEQLAANIPAQTELHLGMVANFTRETEYLSPTETVLVKRTHKFDLNSVIVDIAGGEPLPSRLRSETLASPGEILVLDSLGNLVFHNELDDIPAYKQYTYRAPEAGTEEEVPEEEPEPEAGASRPAREARAGR